MRPCAEDAARELLARIDALRQSYDAQTVIPFGRARAREKLFAAADRFSQALAEPAASFIQPWSPWDVRAKR